MIGRHAHRDPEGDTDAGLFVDLADRGLGEGLAGIDLALGEGHVAVLGAVDQQDAELALDEAPQHAAGCVNDVL